jgi:O-Antigen ligase
MRSGRAADLALLVAVFTITLVRLRWPVGGSDVYLSDLTVAAFLALFLVHRLVARDRSVPRTVVVLLAFLALLSVVYLVGYFNLETSADRSQFTKGLAKFALHFAFLACAVAHLARRSTHFYWQTLGAFVAGIALNAAYAVLEFLYAMGGRGFLDPLILGPITGDTSEGIARVGVVSGVDIYRSNGLMLDVNHLGVALIVPILVLLPLYLRLERGHPMRLPLVLTLGVLALGEIVTLSRSGALGLVVGLVILAIPYRRLMASRRLLVPVGALAGILVLVSLQYSTIVSGFLRSRTSLSGRGTQTHFDLYELLPQSLDAYPFFGRGLNTFSTYFEFLTGRDNWGPHSYYIALLVETGIVGTLLFLAFIVFVFRRLGVLRRLGRALAAVGDVDAARVQPLAWGLTAALAGTLAANVFYLTMQMYYFFVFLLLAVAAPVVFSRR